MRPLEFSDYLEVSTFSVAMYLFGYGADRSHEIMTATGFLVASLMFLFSVTRRGN